jgi:hypothetical protein
MTAINRFRRIIWPVALVTCILVIGLSLFFTILSGGPQWWSSWISFPLFPFLPIILIAFLFAVTRVSSALKRYRLEADACEAARSAIATFHDPAEIRTTLNYVLEGNTAIGMRLRNASDSGDLDTAWSVVQVPQPMDVEEDKTFGEIQFWRSALVLLGLLSTVIFFAQAFTSAGPTADLKDLPLLVNDLQRALTMTMAGIATSVVLGWISTRLFNIQQNLKLEVDELTALMLPRLLPHYEKGTKDEPGPALIIEKLQDFLREVEGWKDGLGVDVNQLSLVLEEHREILAKLPAVTLPSSFSKLDATLATVATAISETKDVNTEALKILSADRNINLDSVLNLLREVRLDTERIKNSHTTLLDTVIPKQTKALDELTTLNATLTSLGEVLTSASREMKETSARHADLINTNKAIQTELSRLSQPKDERVVARLDELLTGISNVQAQNSTINQNLQNVVSAITSLGSVLNTRPIYAEEPYVRRPPRSEPKSESRTEASPKSATTASSPASTGSPKPVYAPPGPPAAGPRVATVVDTKTASEKNGWFRKARDWFKR